MPGRDEILTHPVTMYAKQVTAGRLKKNCGPYEIKACQRHLDDLKRIGDPDFPYVFDVTRADRIYRWFTLCIQSRGPEAGQPVQLQEPRPGGRAAGAAAGLAAVRPRLRIRLGA